MRINNSIPQYLVIVASALLFGCLDPGGGDDPNTYSSCRIVESKALLPWDRYNDELQCWNAYGNGYQEYERAVVWCESEIRSYIQEKYTIPPSMTYQIDTTSC
ncbi:hypothetical protein ACVFI8_09435 [Agarivorans sp. MS3-6]